MLNRTDFALRMIGLFVLSMTLLILFSRISYSQPPASVPPVDTGKPPQDVNVINPETNPVPTTVENEVSDPVPTFDVDRQEIDPYQESINFVIPDGSQNGEGLITTVPNGMRLVIEYVSVHISLPIDVVVRSVGVRIPDSFGNNTIHRLPFPPGIDDVFNDKISYSFGAPTQFYAGQGREVRIVVTRNRLSDGAIGEGGSVDATISGFLVPCGGTLGNCE